VAFSDGAKLNQKRSQEGFNKAWPRSN